MTGNLPNRHGIVNNTFIQPGKFSPDWYWHRRHVKGTTLYDEAKKAGMKTAALLWPVTAKADIDYNMPEIFANRPWHHQIPVSLSNGSPRYQLEMNSKFGHIRNGLSQPELDDFVLEATVETIKTRKPELMLIHFVDLDPSVICTVFHQKKLRPRFTAMTSDSAESWKHSTRRALLRIQLLPYLATTVHLMSLKW
ncbi:alkaline phosphodiesterase I [Mesobacillus boroniphilus JCM 21738]|uniref:Alkaline phosphodiesterase I n=1 Tax=Mesobacillus boroniphilus JCM 21738 TaxID=1294265 RepID=W4RUW6_9BACI|nr:alkaline phosphodiesterase I [Mesobacillus boroniphilus JCM 21738]